MIRQKGPRNMAFNTCLECGVEVSAKFCSKSHANSYNNRLRVRTNKSKKAISQTLEGRHHSRGNGSNSCKIFFKDCISCNKKFCVGADRKDRKTCGQPVCLKQAKVSKMNFKNPRKKVIKVINPYTQKVVCLDSTWEKTMADILDRNGIEWSRPKPLIWTDSTGTERHYFADFYLPNQGVYLDPKNAYCMSLDQAKLAAIRIDHYVLAGRVEEITDQLERIIKRPLL